jgi:hypothetical protein
LDYLGFTCDHRLAQAVAYGDLGNENPAVITPTYEQRAAPVIELQLEKAGIRLAYLLNANFNGRVLTLVALHRLALSMLGGKKDQSFQKRK